jgi:hypothetical protein
MLISVRRRSTAVLAVRAAGTARPAGASNRLVHDSADGAGAPAALGAAAKTTVDLTRGAWRLLGSERGADVLIA